MPAPGRLIHRLFEGSIAIKGVFAALEALTGLGLLLTSNSAIQALADLLTRTEIAQDPQDPMALYVRHAAASLSIETQHFYALYLLAHGVVKLGLVGGLMAGLRWAYPAAVAVFAGFIAYQMIEWTNTRSVFLLLLSAFDTFIVLLVLREWRAHRAKA